MWRITPIHRALASVLAGAMVATSLPPQLFAQSPLHWSTSHAASPFDLQHLDLNALSIPPTLGHLVDVWQPEGRAEGVVFHLQDIHAHAEAQFQLSTLIDELQQAAGVKLVAVEGTAGRCETELYSSLPDPPSTDTVARLFVREGLFSGPEYYAITHPDRVTLWGVEDDALFREHLDISQESSASSVLLADILSRLQKALEDQTGRLWPADVQRLHHLRRQYEADRATASLTAYIDALLKQLEALRSRPEAYPQLLQFSETQYVLARLRAAQVDHERRQLLRALRKQLPLPQRRQLAQLNGHFERQELSPATYYAALLALAGAAGKRYVTLHRYAQGLRRQAAIKPAVLQEELHALHDRMQEARLTEERAHVLAQLLEQILLLSALVQTRLSPPEYARYQALAGTLTAPRLWGTLQRVDVAGWPVTVEDLSQVMAGLQPYQRFYELARQRDDALVRNTLAQMQAQGKPSAVLVAGGFHTPGLRAQLQAHNVAYAVIAPRVTEAFDPVRYESRLRREIPSLEALAAKLSGQTLALGNMGSSAEMLAPFEGSQVSLRAALWARFMQLKRRLAKRAEDYYDGLQQWVRTYPQIAEQLDWALTIADGAVQLSGRGINLTLASGENAPAASSAGQRISQADRKPLRAPRQASIRSTKPRLDHRRWSLASGLRALLGSTALAVLLLVGGAYPAGAQGPWPTPIVTTTPERAQQEAAGYIRDLEQGRAAFSLQLSGERAATQLEYGQDFARFYDQLVVEARRLLQRQGTLSIQELIVLAKRLHASSDSGRPAQATPSAANLAEAIQAFQRQLAGASTEQGVNHAVEGFERALRAGLREGTMRSAEAARALEDELNAALLRHAPRYLIAQSPGGLGDEHALVLYAVRDTKTLPTDQGPIEVHYVRQVTRFSDGRFRGNPGWSDPGAPYVVVFEDASAEIDRAHIQPALEGRPAFWPTRYASPEKAQELHRLATLHGAFVRLGLGKVASQRAERLAIENEAIAQHETEHKRRTRMLGLKEGDVVHSGLEEELAELASMIHAEPFHVLAHVIELAASDRETFASSVLWRLTGQTSRAGMLQVLEETVVKESGDQLKLRARRAYEQADEQWRLTNAPLLRRREATEKARRDKTAVRLQPLLGQRITVVTPAGAASRTLTETMLADVRSGKVTVDEGPDGKLILRLTAGMGGGQGTIRSDTALHVGLRLVNPTEPGEVYWTLTAEALEGGEPVYTLRNETSGAVQRMLRRQLEVGRWAVAVGREPLANGAARQLEQASHTVYPFRQGAMLHTRLSPEELAAAGDGRVIVEDAREGGLARVTAARYSQAWISADSGLPKVNELLGPGFRGGSLLEEVRRRHEERARSDDPDRPIVVLEWGLGAGQALTDLAYALSDAGITNVKLIGFGNKYYPDWEWLAPGIQVIWDTAEHLPEYLQPGEVDVMFSLLWLNYLEEEYVPHVRSLKPFLHKTGILVQFPAQPEWVEKIPGVQAEWHDRLVRMTFAPPQSRSRVAWMKRVAAALALMMGPAVAGAAAYGMEEAGSVGDLVLLLGGMVGVIWKLSSLGRRLAARVAAALKRTTPAAAIPAWFPDYTAEAVAALNEALEAINRRFGTPERPGIVLAATHSNGSIARGQAMPYSDVDRLVMLHDLSPADFEAAKALLQELLANRRLRLDQEDPLFGAVWVHRDELEQLLIKQRSESLDRREQQVVETARQLISSTPDAAPGPLTLKRFFDRQTQRPLSEQLALLAYEPPAYRERSISTKSAVRERLFQAWAGWPTSLKEAVWTLHMAAASVSKVALEADQMPQVTVPEDALVSLVKEGYLLEEPLLSREMPTLPSGARRFRALWCDRYVIVLPPGEKTPTISSSMAQQAATAFLETLDQTERRVLAARLDTSGRAHPLTDIGLQRAGELAREILERLGRYLAELPEAERETCRQAITDQLSQLPLPTPPAGTLVAGPAPLRHQNRLPRRAYTLPSKRFGGAGVNLVTAIEEVAREELGFLPLLSLVGSATYAVTPDKRVRWGLVTDIDVRVHLPPGQPIDGARFSRRLAEHLQARGLQVEPDPDAAGHVWVLVDRRGRKHELSLGVAREAEAFAPGSAKAMSHYRPHDYFFGDVSRLQPHLAAAGEPGVLASAGLLYAETLIRAADLAANRRRGDRRKALRQLAQLAYLRGWRDEHQALLDAAAQSAKDFDAAFPDAYRDARAQLEVAAPEQEQALREDLRAMLKPSGTEAVARRFFASLGWGEPPYWFVALVFAPFYEWPQTYRLQKFLDSHWHYDERQEWQRTVGVALIHFSSLLVFWALPLWLMFQFGTDFGPALAEGAAAGLFTNPISHALYNAWALYVQQPTLVADAPRAPPGSAAKAVNRPSPRVLVDAVVRASHRSSRSEISPAQQATLQAWLETTEPGTELPPPVELKELFMDLVRGNDAKFRHQYRNEWAARLSEKWAVDAQRILGLLRWLDRYVILTRTSPETLEAFLRAYIEAYRVGPTPKPYFMYVVDPAADDDQKLRDAIGNLQQMATWFTEEFRGGYAVSAPLEGTPYFLGMRYGLGEGTFGVELMLGKTNGSANPTSGVFFRIGLDTQGRTTLRNLRLGGTRDAEPLIREFWTTMGISPAELLLRVAAQCAQDRGFAAFVGVDEAHHPKSSRIHLPYRQIYRQAGLKSRHPLGLTSPTGVFIDRLTRRINRSTSARRTVEQALSAWQTLEQSKAWRRHDDAPAGASWAATHTPRAAQRTWASFQFEMGVDSSLYNQLVRIVGEQVERGELTPDAGAQLLDKIPQATMAGGLGALMPDLVPGLADNGPETVAVSPLYNAVRGDRRMGEYLREAMQRAGYREVRMPIQLRDLEPFEVVAWVGRLGQATQVWLDFADHLYPGTEERVWQMALFNEAAQEILMRLRADGTLQGEGWVLLENEVYVALPKPRLKGALIIGANHSVVPNTIPSYHRDLLEKFIDLGDLLDDPAVVNGDGMVRMTELHARRVRDSGGRLIGVSSEHTEVLRRDIFPNDQDLVVYNDNTNGVYLNRWQHPQLRDLCARYRRQLVARQALAQEAEWPEFFEALEGESDLWEAFMREVDAIKQQEMQGFLHWLKIRHGVEWQADPAAPLGSDLRRIVPYKALDVVVGMLSMPEGRQAFLDSGVRLLVGGRTFEAAHEFGPKQLTLLEQLLEHDEALRQRIAIIPDYNIGMAETTIFPAVNFTLMLADRYMEAAATSPQKGLPNAAISIAVRNGAPLDWLRDWREPGHELDGNGLWVNYSGDRPEGWSVIRAFEEVGRIWKDDTLRRRHQYQALKTGMTAADITARQARGILRIAERALMPAEAVAKPAQVTILNGATEQVALRAGQAHAIRAHVPLPQGVPTVDIWTHVHPLSDGTWGATRSIPMRVVRQIAPDLWECEGEFLAAEAGVYEYTVRAARVAREFAEWQDWAWANGFSQDRRLEFAASPRKATNFSPAPFQAELREGSPFKGATSRRGVTDLQQIAAAVYEDPGSMKVTTELLLGKGSVTFILDAGYRALLNEEELQALLESLVWKLGLEEGAALRDARIVIPLFDTSRYLSEDHNQQAWPMADGTAVRLFGTNRGLVALPPSMAKAALQVNWLHELRYEAAGPETDHSTLEAGFISDDVRFTLEKLDDSAELAAYVAALEALVEPEGYLPQVQALSQALAYLSQSVGQPITRGTLYFLGSFLHAHPVLRESAVLEEVVAPLLRADMPLTAWAALNDLLTRQPALARRETLRDELLPVWLAFSAAAGTQSHNSFIRLQELWTAAPAFQNPVVLRSTVMPLAQAVGQEAGGIVAALRHWLQAGPLRINLILDPTIFEQVILPAFVRYPHFGTISQIASFVSSQPLLFSSTEVLVEIVPPLIARGGLPALSSVERLLEKDPNLATLPVLREIILPLVEVVGERSPQLLLLVTGSSLPPGLSRELMLRHVMLPLAEQWSLESRAEEEQRTRAAIELLNACSYFASHLPGKLEELFASAVIGNLLIMARIEPEALGPIMARYVEARSAGQKPEDAVLFFQLHRTRMEGKSHVDLWQSVWGALGRWQALPAGAEAPGQRELLSEMREALSRPLDHATGNWKFLDAPPAWMLAALAAPGAPLPAWLERDWPKWSYKLRLSFGLMVATVRLLKLPPALLAEMPIRQRSYDQLMSCLRFWWDVHPGSPRFQGRLWQLLTELPPATSRSDRAQFLGQAMTLMQRLAHYGSVIGTLNLEDSVTALIEEVILLPLPQRVKALARVDSQLNSLVVGRIGELLGVQLDPQKLLPLQAGDDLWRLVVTYHAHHTPAFRELLGRYVLTLHQTGDPAQASAAAWQWWEAQRVVGSNGAALAAPLRTLAPAVQTLRVMPEGGNIQEQLRQATAREYAAAREHLDELLATLAPENAERLQTLLTEWTDPAQPPPTMGERLKVALAEMQLPETPLLRTVRQHLQQARMHGEKIRFLTTSQEVLIGVATNPLDIVHLGYPSLGGSCLDLVNGGFGPYAQYYALHSQVAVIYAWQREEQGARRMRLARIAVIRTPEGLLPLSALYTSTNLDLAAAMSGYLQQWAAQLHLPLLKPSGEKFEWLLLPPDAVPAELSTTIPKEDMAPIFYSDLSGQQTLPSPIKYSGWRWMPAGDAPTQPTAEGTTVGQATTLLHPDNPHQGAAIAITANGTRDSAVQAQGAEPIVRRLRQGPLETLTLDLFPDIRLAVEVPQSHLQELRDAGWTEAEITRLVAAGVTHHLARGDALMTRAQLDTLAREPLFFAITDASPHLWEDHLGNRRLFMNRALLELKRQGGLQGLIADAHFAAGFVHELAHEATGLGEDEVTEGRLAAIDEAVTTALLYEHERGRDRREPNVSRTYYAQVMRKLLAEVPQHPVMPTPVTVDVSDATGIAAEQVAQLVEVPNEAQAALAAAVGIDPQLASVSRLEYVGLDMAQKRVVNPEDRPLVAVYGGAGNDLLHVLLATNATALYFLDRMPTSFAELAKGLARWQQGWPPERPQNHNKHSKGHSTLYDLETPEDMARQLLLELRGLGVAAADVSVGAHPDDEQLIQVQFWWTYPGSGKRQHYSLTLVPCAMDQFADRSRVSPVLNRVLDQGIDIYYQRGGYDLPAAAHHFLPRIGRALRAGGYAMTDDLTHQDYFFDPAPYLQSDGAIFEPPRRSAAMQQWEEALLAQPAQSGYGWRLFLRRKASSEQSPDVERHLARLEGLAERLVPSEFRLPAHERWRIKLQIYREQLALLAALGILGPDKRVWYPLSGLDVLPALYAGEVRTSDKRLNNEREWAWHARDAYAWLQEHVKGLPPWEALGALVHEDANVMEADFLARWLEGIKAGDVVLLKYTDVFLLAFEAHGEKPAATHRERVQVWVDDLMRRLPVGVTVIVIDGPPAEGVFEQGMAGHLQQQAGVADVLSARLDSAQRARWQRVNQLNAEILANDASQVDFKEIKLAAGSGCHVFQKVQPAEARWFWRLNVALAALLASPGLGWARERAGDAAPASSWLLGALGGLAVLGLLVYLLWRGIGRQAPPLALLQSYDVGTPLRWTRLGRGNAEVWKVTTTTGTYILRASRWRPTLDLLTYEHRLRQRLAAQGVPVPPFLLAQDGRFAVEADGRWYTVLPWTEGEVVSWGEVTGLRLEQAAQALVRFHEALADYEPEGRALAAEEPARPPDVLNPEEVQRRLEAIRTQMAARAPPAGTSAMFDLFLRHYDQLDQARQRLAQRLPPALCRQLPATIIHGDYHPENVVFDAQGVAAILDLDFARRYPRVFDLAQSMPGDRFDLAAFTAYVRAYQAAAQQPLSAEERRALPEIYRAWLLQLAILFGETALQRPPEPQPYKTTLLDNLMALDRVSDAQWEAFVAAVGRKGTPPSGGGPSSATGSGDPGAQARMDAAAEALLQVAGRVQEAMDESPAFTIRLPQNSRTGEGAQEVSLKFYADHQNGLSLNIGFTLNRQALSRRLKTMSALRAGAATTPWFIEGHWSVLPDATPQLMLREAFFDRAQLNGDEIDLRRQGLYSRFAAVVDAQLPFGAHLLLWDIAEDETVRHLNDRLRTLLRQPEWEEIAGLVPGVAIGDIPWNAVHRQLGPVRAAAFRRALEEALPGSPFWRVWSRLGYDVTLEEESFVRVTAFRAVKRKTAAVLTIAEESYGGTFHGIQRWPTWPATDERLLVRDTGGREVLRVIYNYDPVERQLNCLGSGVDNGVPERQGAGRAVLAHLLRAHPEARYVWVDHPTEKSRDFLARIAEVNGWIGSPEVALEYVRFDVKRIPSAGEVHALDQMDAAAEALHAGDLPGAIKQATDCSFCGWDPEKAPATAATVVEATHVEATQVAAAIAAGVPAGSALAQGLTRLRAQFELTRAGMPAETQVTPAARATAHQIVDQTLATAASRTRSDNLLRLLSDLRDVLHELHVAGPPDQPDYWLQASYGEGNALLLQWIAEAEAQGDDPGRYVAERLGFNRAHITSGMPLVVTAIDPKASDALEQGKYQVSDTFEALSDAVVAMLERGEPGLTGPAGPLPLDVSEDYEKPGLWTARHDYRHRQFFDQLSPDDWLLLWDWMADIADPLKRWWSREAQRLGMPPAAVRAALVAFRDGRLADQRLTTAQRRYVARLLIDLSEQFVRLEEHRHSRRSFSARTFTDEELRALAPFLARVDALHLMAPSADAAALGPPAGRVRTALAAFGLWLLLGLTPQATAAPPTSLGAAPLSAVSISELASTIDPALTPAERHTIAHAYANVARRLKSWPADEPRLEAITRKIEISSRWKIFRLLIASGDISLLQLVRVIAILLAFATSAPVLWSREVKRRYKVALTFSYIVLGGPVYQLAQYVQAEYSSLKGVTVPDAASGVPRTLFRLPLPAAPTQDSAELSNVSAHEAAHALMENVAGNRWTQIWFPEAVGQLHAAQTRNPAQGSNALLYVALGQSLMSGEQDPRQRAESFRRLVSGPYTLAPGGAGEGATLGTLLSEETPDTRLFGQALAGMAYELGRQLGNEAWAWEYLKRLMRDQTLPLERVETEIRREAAATSAITPPPGPRFRSSRHATTHGFVTLTAAWLASEGSPWAGALIASLGLLGMIGEWIGWARLAAAGRWLWARLRARPAQGPPAQALQAARSIPREDRVEQAQEHLRRLIHEALARTPDRPVVLRLDGVSAAGKTTVADWIGQGGAGPPVREVLVVDDSDFGVTEEDADEMMRQAAQRLAREMPQLQARGVRLVVISALGGYWVWPDSQCDLVVQIQATSAMQEERVERRHRLWSAQQPQSAIMARELAQQPADLMIDTTTMSSESWQPWRRQQPASLKTDDGEDAAAIPLTDYGVPEGGLELHQWAPWHEIDEEWREEIRSAPISFEVLWRGLTVGSLAGWQTERSIVISNIGIDTAQQGRGLGAAALRWLAEQAQAQGQVLFVETASPSLLGALQKSGLYLSINDGQVLAGPEDDDIEQHPVIREWVARDVEMNVVASLQPNKPSE